VPLMHKVPGMPGVKRSPATECSYRPSESVPETLKKCTFVYPASTGKLISNIKTTDL
jgi:hypothetical protein